MLNSLLGSEFYAKVQPLKHYKVKSAVSGQIIKVNKALESNNVKNNYIIQIDSKIDKIDLKQTKIKLNNLKNILEIENNTLKSFNKVSSKSKFDKDNQKIKVLNISSSISDMIIKIETLKDKIAKKDIRVKNIYIDNIAVEKGDYVNPGTLLYSGYDLTKSKLEIFIPIDTIDLYKNKTIYIDGKKTNLKINKIYKVADTKYISSYKCEIILDTKIKFSKVVKVTFK
jgi:hypothetical protein